MRPYQLRRALKCNPNQCPKCLLDFCPGDAIGSGSIIDPDTGSRTRKVKCSACGYRWSETYILDLALDLALELS